MQLDYVQLLLFVQLQLVHHSNCKGSQNNKTQACKKQYFLTPGILDNLTGLHCVIQNQYFVIIYSSLLFQTCIRNLRSLPQVI